MPALTPAQRQARLRARVARDGGARITIDLDAAAVATLARVAPGLPPVAALRQALQVLARLPSD